MNIYVGNLPYNATEDELRQAFEAFGQVSSVKIIMDRDTGRSKGFGFVEMPTASEGSQAIGSLNGSPMNGRPLRVNEAQPRPDAGRRPMRRP
ncbi:MAG: RNA-binding protein [Gammaproteobacteria bacterium]|nr:RNA-binding protein [Gammaproteobacteria bacterium]